MKCDAKAVGCKSGVLGKVPVLEYWRGTSVGVLGPKTEKDQIVVLRSLLLQDVNTVSSAKFIIVIIIFYSQLERCLIMSEIMIMSKKKI